LALLVTRTWPASTTEDLIITDPGLSCKQGEPALFRISDGRKIPLDIRPATFDRLADLCDQVYAALDGYHMLPEIYRQSLDALASELRIWRDYAQKIVDGNWLSQEEQNDIHLVGGWLRWMFEAEWGDQKPEEKSAMLVADIASDSENERGLHEGTGHFNPLIAVYTPRGEEPIAGIGDVFSHYEFAEPDWNRLNDAEWADRLQEDPPSRPPWASSFLPFDWAQIIYLPWVACNPGE
jgi:hypothetical protein